MEELLLVPKSNIQFPTVELAPGPRAASPGYTQAAVFTPLSHQLALVFSKITRLNVSFLQTCIHTEYSIVALHVQGSVYITRVLPSALSHILVIWWRVGPGVWGFDPGNILLLNIIRMQGGRRR